MDWSVYHAAVLHLRPNISVAIDPRLLKSKIWNVWKESVFHSFSPGPIRLMVFIANPFLFKTLVSKPLAGFAGN